jgi:PTS hybrid protein
MVSLMLLSHSAKVAEGTRELAAQMAGAVEIIAAGGTADGRTGSDFDRTFAAMRDAAARGDVIVLADLGSARMAGQLAAEALDESLRPRVFLSDAALVEGAIAAALAIAAGYDAGQTLAELRPYALPKNA